MADKNIIFNKVKNLKTYNNELKCNDKQHPNVYITEHLPLKFQQQRKRLLNAFKEARENNKKLFGKR